MTYSESMATISCTSTGGPPTTVTWLREGTEISLSDYMTSQELRDFVNATYVSHLVGVATGSLLGEFTCIVENARGRANQSLLLDGEEDSPSEILMLNLSLLSLSSLSSLSLSSQPASNSSQPCRHPLIPLC